MHVSALAFDSVFTATIVCLNLGIGTAIVTAAHRRPRFTWWLALGFVALAMYFAMLTITAGSAPVWPRGDLAIPIRCMLLISMALLTAWGICLVGEMVRHGRTQHTLRLAVLVATVALLAGCTQDAVVVRISPWAVDVGLALIFVALVVSAVVGWSACVVAGRVDDRMEE